ncbi:hypothetical protein FM121_09445 [Vagococcus fluvialis bH819]|uniref:Uncharacterized protein n=1 Tax=Vagococcus fluvialis bH819 TaxID=1255619 RepID=A0A1X6WPZ1_9ENTE|nr:hypothetical protein FM121_09445 [Vagococcus fluvialis bH819]
MLQSLLFHLSKKQYTKSIILLYKGVNPSMDPNRNPKKEYIYRTVSLGIGILIALFLMKYL